MPEPTLAFLPCPDAGAGHRMAYWQWGDPAANHVVLCVHGLTRQGRDFDALATALCARDRGVRVVCPDVVGRGQSDWLADPMGYQVAFYAADMLLLLQHLQPAQLDWVGTSMGGLIGLVLAGQLELPVSAPVRRLVLNDVGPSLEWSALQRIAQYVGQGVVFASEQQAADALWAVSQGFGPHTPQQWLALTRPMLKPLGDGSGRLTLHYDPALGLAFRTMTQESNAQAEVLLWQAYDRIVARTMVLRGAESDLLSRATAQAMATRGPKATVLEFAGIGHAPTLVAAPQVDAVVSFLLD